MYKKEPMKSHEWEIIRGWERKERVIISSLGCSTQWKIKNNSNCGITTHRYLYVKTFVASYRIPCETIRVVHLTRLKKKLNRSSRYSLVLL